MEPALDSTQLVRLLASDDRRKVVAALVLIDAAASPTAIAQRADLSLRTVVDSLDRLVTGSKRLIVLDHMVQVFDIGKRYSEPEVNERLRPFSDDVAMSRRYLVDERFLDRSGGEYWRCGGSV